MLVSLRHPHRSIALIPGKTFVAAITIQRDGHVLASHLGQVVGWDGRRVGIWLAIMPHESRKDLYGVRSDNEFMVFSAESFCYSPGVPQFVKLFLIEAY